MQIALTVADFLNRGALVYGARVAVVDEPEVPGSLGTLTYAELDDASARLAVLLADRGVRPGGAVGLMLPTPVEFAVAVLDEIGE